MYIVQGPAHAQYLFCEKPCPIQILFFNLRNISTEVVENNNFQASRGTFKSAQFSSPSPAI